MRKTTLGELCQQGGGGIQTGPFGSQLHASDYVNEGIPSVMPQNIGDNSISTNNIAKISPHDANRLKKYLLVENDIVYSRRGDVEKRALVRAEHEGWLCGTGCLRVRFGPDSACDPRFVSYFLGTETSRSWVRQHAIGATMPNLNTSILSDFPIELPPLEMQIYVADILSAFDEKISCNRKMLLKLERMSDLLFAQAAGGCDFGNESFEDIAIIGGGGTPNTSEPNFWDGEISWVTPTDVTALDAPYLESTSRTISELGLINCSSPVYPAGSILMTSRATIGAFALAQQPTAVNQGFIVVNSKDPLLQLWVYHEMRSRVAEFASYANGATFLELSRGQFKGLKVRVPPRSTAEQFNLPVSAIHRLSASLNRESGRLRALRDFLLPYLISGTPIEKDAELLAESIFQNTKLGL